MKTKKKLLNKIAVSDPDLQARLLVDALPYMQNYDGKTVVIKYGGHAMGEPELGNAFARDVALLRQAGVNPIVVHGGGPQIETMLKKVGIKSKFKQGLRVTDKPTMEIVEMVLAGYLNKKIVADFNQQGAQAIGLTGKDGNMVTAVKAKKNHKKTDSKIEKIIDLGFVGEPKKINKNVLNMLIQSGLIPVIAPVALGEDGETYNINADMFAGAIAAEMNAQRLLFLTDVEGVLDKNKKLIKNLTVKEAKKLIRNQTISDGMIPKVETCIKAIQNGVKGVVIVNGKTIHAVLLELLTHHGAGTLIVP